MGSAADLTTCHWPEALRRDVEADRIDQDGLIDFSFLVQEESHRPGRFHFADRDPRSGRSTICSVPGLHLHGGYGLISNFRSRKLLQIRRIINITRSTRKISNMIIGRGAGLMPTCTAHRSFPSRTPSRTGSSRSWRSGPTAWYMEHVEYANSDHPAARLHARRNRNPDSPWSEHLSETPRWPRQQPDGPRPVNYAGDIGLVISGSSIPALDDAARKRSRWRRSSGWKSPAST